VGAQCAICHELPTKVACYDMGGISLIEKYCDKCVEKINIVFASYRLIHWHEALGLASLYYY
jgi:hypothetical protein